MVARGFLSQGLLRNVSAEIILELFAILNLMEKGIKHYVCVIVPAWQRYFWLYGEVRISYLLILTQLSEQETEIEKNQKIPKSFLLCHMFSPQIY